MQSSTLSLQPVVICVAPNGARRGKADHARLPLTASEIAEEAERIADAGAHAMHLHVRDDLGRHTLDPGQYRKALSAIRDRIGDRLVIQVTTESVGMYRVEEQIAVVRELVPDCISFAIRELIPTPQYEGAAREFLAWTQQQGIGIQFILYSADDVGTLLSLKVPIARPHGLFVLGRYATNGVSDPRDLLPFLERWPRDWPWSICAFGRTEPLCLAAAIGLGGHVRVGFENNLTAPDGTLARDNAAGVENIRRTIESSGRPLASLADARALYR
jgi:3-keto-5-aminohexanoate cleavage enzyme